MELASLGCSARGSMVGLAGAGAGLDHPAEAGPSATCPGPRRQGVPLPVWRSAGVYPAGRRGPVGAHAAAVTRYHSTGGPSVPQCDQGAREDLCDLVRPDAEGDRERSKTGEGDTSQQIRALPEAQVQQWHRQAAGQWAGEPRRREMGRSPEDHQPRISSRETQEIDACFRCLLQRAGDQVGGSRGVRRGQGDRRVAGVPEPHRRRDLPRSEGRRIFQIQSEQAQNVVKMLNTLYLPGFKFLPMQLNRRVKANAIEVESLLKGIIGKRERAMREGSAGNEDLLGVLMECNAAESKEAGSSRPIMTMDDIIGELKLFYFAGMDTTAVLLTWTLVALSMHPEWQDRARAEVLRAFGEEGRPDLDGINQLKVVGMVLYEVLRLYPPVIQFDRQTYAEVELGGVRYPPGVILSLPIVFLHHDPDVWGEDADEFRPERFAEGVSKAASGSSSSPVAFFPFGWGPRVCVGQNFAKMALSRILQRFSFGLAPSYRHVPFPVSNLQPDHGAPILLKKL